MFGEKEMLKYCKCSIEAGKGRIFLPEMCCAEKGDKVVILTLPDCIEIWSYADYMEIKELAKVNQYKYADFFTAFLYDDDVKVTSGIRLNLTTELVCEYDLSGKVVVEGKGRYIRIWKDIKFKEYQREQVEEKERVLKRVLTKK